MAKEDDYAHKEQEQQKEDAVTTDSAPPPDNEGSPESSKRNENESSHSAAAEAKKKQKREHNKLKANAHGAHDVDDDKTLELMREKARAEGRTAVGSYRPRNIPKRTRLHGAQQGSSSSSSGTGTSAFGSYPAAYSIEGFASVQHAPHQHAEQTMAAGLHAPHHAQPPIYNIISQYWYGNFDDEDLADPAEWHVMPTNGVDDNAPPLTRSEAHTRHKEMSDILVFVAGLKDKEAEQNIRIAQDVDLAGWVKGRAAHVENTLQRFGGARATTHVYRQLEATAKQAREALRGLGVAGLPDFSSGGGSGGVDGGGGSGSGGGGAGTSSAGGTTARE